jgi:hypothetical protein
VGQHRLVCCCGVAAALHWLLRVPFQHAPIASAALSPPPPPAGLIRRKQNPQLPNQEMVDLIWLALDASGFPDAVKRMLPQASADW